MKKTSMNHYCRHCNTKMESGEYLTGMPPYHHNSDNRILNTHGMTVGTIIYCPNCGEIRVLIN